MVIGLKLIAEIQRISPKNSRKKSRKKSKKSFLFKYFYILYILGRFFLFKIIDLRNERWKNWGSKVENLGVKGGKFGG